MTANANQPIYQSNSGAAKPPREDIAGYAGVFADRAINPQSSQGIRKPFECLDVDLSIARPTGVTFPIQGTYIYADFQGNGRATLELDSVQSGTLAPFLVESGFEIQQDFASVKITNTAYPAGTTLRLMYATGAKARNLWGSGQLAQKSQVLFPAAANAAAGVASIFSGTVFVGKGTLIKRATWRLDANNLVVGAGGAYALGPQMQVSDSTGVNTAYIVGASSAVGANSGSAGQAIGVMATIQDYKLPDGYDTVALGGVAIGTYPATDVLRDATNEVTF